MVCLVKIEGAAPVDIPDNGRSPSGLRWPFDAIVLLVVAVPAFSGYPLQLAKHEVIAGIAWSWPVYLAVVHLTLCFLFRGRIYANIVAAGALITVPVVFAGAALTQLLYLAGIAVRDPAANDIHYVQLCLTMLTVVPLAVGLVASLPFNRFERRLLAQPRGIRPFQKKLLMSTRVFQHIAFFVLPNTLEVLREELPGQRWRQQWQAARLRTVSLFIGDCIHLAVEIICSSLQYIPLWAHEISRLPERNSRNASKH